MAVPVQAGTFPGDNGRIAYASAGPDGADIYSVRPDGSHVRRLVRTPSGDLSVFSDWSPDWRLLAFDSNRSGDVEIYLRLADGAVRRLTHNPARDAYPSWAPDGRRIVFESDRSGSRQVHIVNSDGTGERRLTHFAPGAEEPSYSPTGEWIAFLSGPLGGRAALFLVRPDGTGVHQITPRSLDAGHPSWSPDGRLIVFNSNIEKPNSRIWVVGLDGHPKQISHARVGFDDFEPAFSPDGRLIAFSSTRRDGHDADIWVMRADGSDLRNITPHSPGFDVGVAWAPR